jgi:hypothetical protein
MKLTIVLKSTRSAGPFGSTVRFSLLVRISRQILQVTPKERYNSQALNSYPRLAFLIDAFSFRSTRCRNSNLTARRRSRRE